MAIDLIAKYCQTCQHYIQVTQECCLLKENRLEVIFAIGPCQPAEMVRQVVKSLLSKRRNERKNLTQDILSTAFELTELLKQQRLTKRFTIYALKSYLTKTIRERLLPRLHCEDCSYLSLTKPAICQRETIISANGEVVNPNYGNKRFPSDHACTGFEALAPSGSAEINSENKILLLLIADALSQRAVHARDQNKAEYERHYLVFSLLVQWCEEEDCSWQEWKQYTASLFHKTVRTIERDLDKMIKFLQESDVI
ncbi:hypothetical protein U27_05032 [Candidatus Vecturithrix granuli]|uniref:Uncharacterized protein n=1 Tax=Vecturithrix granuli TaxID=1499967 RepID=A0A081C0F4_VECG1|nr:hypothetical protein U27_05032 [Candidatus Vecturithrix granuli]